MNRDMSGSVRGLIDEMLSGSVAGNINVETSGGSNVTITPTLESGTKIADFTIDDTSGVLYAPTPEPPIEYQAGDNITIEDGVISATDTTYTAGTGISIDDGVISATSDNQVPPIYYDFTKYRYDMNHYTAPKNNSADYVSQGLSFTAGDDYFEIEPRFFYKNMVYEIEIVSLNVQDTTRHNSLLRFLTSSNANGGFKFRSQTQTWSVWDGVTGWQDSNLTDRNYFNNSTLKIIIDDDSKWHIYKDNVEVYVTPIGVENVTDSFGIGAPSTAITNMIIKSFKIYPYTP